MNGTATTWYAPYLAEFRPGTAAWTIAEALLTAREWLSVADLTVTAGCHRTRVATTVQRLRSLGVQVAQRRLPDGQSVYLVAVKQDVAA